MMKKIFLTILMSASLLAPLPARTEEEWKELRSTHFIVYYKNAPEEFVRQVSSRAEDYYNSIADDLGFSRFDFWLWENRAQIYIYDNAELYQEQTGSPAWSSGKAVIDKKMIYTFPKAKDFCETLLPHELGHIIFREVVGFNNPAVPIWLDEGVAQYQENLHSGKALLMAKEAMRRGIAVSLETLGRLDPRGMDSASAGLFYAESVSVVDYLIRRFGKDAFVTFCRELRDRKDLDAAASGAYPFKNIAQMDQAWQEYLKQ